VSRVVDDMFVVFLGCGSHDFIHDECYLKLAQILLRETGSMLVTIVVACHS